MKMWSTVNILYSTKRVATWSMAVIGLTVTAFAQAQAIPIVNAGFNNDVLNCTPGPACYDGTPSGWSGGAATWKPSTGPGSEFPGGVPGGANVVVLGNAAVSGALTQDLGFAPLANTTYTLTVYVGQRADACGSPVGSLFPCLIKGYAAELLVGTTIVASDTTLRPATGTSVSGRSRRSGLGSKTRRN